MIAVSFCMMEEKEWKNINLKRKKNLEKNWKAKIKLKINII